MPLSKKIKDAFANSDKIIALRYRSAKIAFLLCTFVFFLNYFFVGARFHYETNLALLPFTYTLFVFSLILYIYYATVEKLQGKVPKAVLYFLFLVLMVIAVIVLFSFVIDLGNFSG